MRNTKYPDVNLARFRTDFVKRDDDDQIDIGWNEGVLTDGRPYRAELWAESQIWFFTIYFSSFDIKHFSPIEIKEYLRSERIIEFDDEKFLSSGFNGINVDAKKEFDDSGNPIWRVTVIVGDEGGTYVSDGIIMQQSKKESSNQNKISNRAKQDSLVDAEQLERKKDPEKTCHVNDFTSDATVKWLCQKGDFVLWLTWPEIFADASHSAMVKDIWEMKKGDFLTITDRIEDMPVWFSLHPTEVCNGVAYRLLEKFNAGEYPGEPIEGHNIWRLKIGDRLVWIRKSFEDGASQSSIISVLAFRENALVIGGNLQTQFNEELTSFGLLNKHNNKEEYIAMVHSAVNFVRQMGVPREFASEWTIG